MVGSAPEEKAQTIHSPSPQSTTDHLLLPPLCHCWRVSSNTEAEPILGDKSKQLYHRWRTGDGQCQCSWTPKPRMCSPNALQKVYNVTFQSRCQCYGVRKMWVLKWYRLCSFNSFWAEKKIWKILSNSLTITSPTLLPRNTRISNHCMKAHKEGKYYKVLSFCIILLWKLPFHPKAASSKTHIRDQCSDQLSVNWLILTDLLDF